jgi:hypothetical protein
MVLHRIESAGEFVVGVAQAGFRVELQLAREVGQHEQQVADLIGQTGRIGVREFGAKFLNFLFKFGEDLIGVGPVEADGGGSVGQFDGSGQSGQGDRHPGEGAELPAGGAFGGFLRLPGRGLGRGVADGRIAEYVRVAAYHLVADAFRDIAKGEQTGFLGEAGVVDDLEQQVAEFVRQGGEIAVGDGVGDLVGFLDGVGRDGVEALVLVPRAAIGRVAQGGHDVQQAADFGFGRGCGVGHGRRIGERFAGCKSVLSGRPQIANENVGRAGHFGSGGADTPSTTHGPPRPGSRGSGDADCMASKKTVTLDNLAALGPERLAAILVELADGDAELKGRLRLELAAQAGGDTIAAEIGKRITALKNARSFVDWQKRRDFVKDLDLQRTMIVERVAQGHPDLALDLMWRFMALAEPVINRVDDSNGSVGDVFRSACEDLGAIAVKARPDPTGLADRVFAALSANDYGVFDGLVKAIVPGLGEAGVAHLKNRLAQELANAGPKAGGQDWRARAMRHALQEIADSESDVDAYIALVPLEDRDRPHIGTEIGRRLLDAGRATEALAALEEAGPKQRARQAGNDNDLQHVIYGPDSAWEDVYIEALDSTGQKKQAQTLRWAAFEKRLSSEQLRAYLKNLPDFDDFEAEERAMKYALGFGGFSAALDFLREWPDQTRAAQLVLTRPSEIDGNFYFLLDPMARLIEGKHPLAATLLQRAMIEDTLNGPKSSRYKHAARHLLECQSLASSIRDYGTFETHDAFASRLRAKHSRKVGFWAQLADLSGTRR